MHGQQTYSINYLHSFVIKKDADKLHNASAGYLCPLDIASTVTVMKLY